MVMGGDSCSKDREIESWYRILDGHFSHLFIVKIVMCVCFVNSGNTTNQKISND